ncbi:NUDIX hydrolase [Clostridium thermobutyricum]|uniref:NUDIX hydrolase n=1 Tax=Clostridium thermobutyricum TaxID=29372 RepID=UPI0018A95957|nr:NUDIX hydrolase [Clostridium thermobutyricum]
MHNLIAHALIQNEKEEILIIKRTTIKRGKKNFEGGKWDIPGGTVENLEFPSVAVVREVKEEVGLDVNIESILYEKSNLDKEKQAVFTTLIYSCKINDSLDIVLDLEEHDDYKWVTKEEILKIDNSELVSYIKETIKLLKERN